MREIGSTQVNPLTAVKRAERDRFHRPMKLWSCGLMASAILGVFSGVTGLALNVTFLFGLAENKGLMGALAIWLLIAAFPMLWLTSHCLDKVDSIHTARRLESCRERGLNETDISRAHN